MDAMRKTPYIAGLIVALGAGVAFGALVLGDDDSEAKGGSVRTVHHPPPKLKHPSKIESGKVLGFQLSQPLTRQVTIQGGSYVWNGSTGRYEPSGGFNRTGLLVIDTNGDFGIFAGADGDASAGQIWFATNSYVYRLIQGPAASVWLSKISAANVSESNGGQALAATVNTNARTVQLNEFAVVGQFEPKQILSGTMQVNLSKTGASGTIDLYGGGYIEPGNGFPVNLYHATFSG